VPRRSWLRIKLVRVAESASSPDTGQRADPGGVAALTGGPARVGAVQAIGDGAAEPGFTGVRLDLLAAEALGSPTRWRQLAEHNDIDNPLDVPAGAVLAVPEIGGRPS